MIDSTFHAYLVKWAGTDLMWNNGPLGKFGPLVGARPNSANRRGLQEFLTESQDGICAFCGEDGADEMCHIVASGPERRGFVPGNIAMGHYACNRDQVTRYGAIVPMAGIARPDIVPTVWPTPTALQTRGKAIGARVA